MTLAVPVVPFLPMPIFGFCGLAAGIIPSRRLNEN
jgi:hypothetical protein